jgi:aspartyl-tRNA(Asn)/glutamyl-tRNA(Gln) amidotransferase subunit A
MKVRQMIKNDFDAAFTKCDAILSPITPNLAFAIDEKPTDPVVIYLNDILAVGVNLAGLPGISVPVGISQNEKLPIGMQIIGNYLDDATMMQVAFAIEQVNRAIL